MCVRSSTATKKYRVLLPFIKDRFVCGDKAVHVVNPDQRRDHLQRLAAVGIDTTAAQQRGQFELRTNTEASVVDIMRTHPMIIIGGILQQNPFFIPPKKFLREFRERRTGRTASTSMAF